MDGPLPDFRGRTVPTVQIVRRTAIYRSHSLAHGPLFFGKRKVHRFDDPRGAYGVLYAAREPAGAFVETFLRLPAGVLMNRSDLDSYGCATIEVVREMRLVPLHGHHLMPLGATAEVTHGPASAYDLPRLWSRAIHELAVDLDGMEYRSRHDDSLLCLAIFERANDALRAKRGSSSWTAEPGQLEHILDKYKVSLV